MTSSRVRLLGFATLLASTLLLAGCDRGGTPAVADTLHVTVSIVPQKTFVERIGGAYVTANAMVEAGDNPATYEPRPEQIKALSQADAYFSIGVPFENAWMDRITAANRTMVIVDTTRGIERMPMGEGEANPDPHVWLSPKLVAIQAQTIYGALAELDPEHEAEFKANLDSFLADIEALDAGIRTALEGVETRKFMVFHPAWGYFARDYDLEMIPIEIGGQEPSAAELTALVSEARAEGIRVIFAQLEFSTRDAQTIATEIGGEVLLISPLAPDWLDNLRRVAETFAQVLSQ